MEFANSIAILLLLVPLVFVLVTRNKSWKRLPPGSLGLPIIGQTLDLLRAMRANKGEEWLKERIRKYGRISKLHLFGSPVVFLHGQAANKFIYTRDQKTLSNQQPASVRRLFGERNILELGGEDHKRMRGALLSFLKPEALKQSVRTIDEEIRMHLKEHWHGKRKDMTVQAMPLTNTLTFNVICSVVFGVEKGKRRDTLVHLFEDVTQGLLAVPIDLPFTSFNRAIRARSKARHIILQLIHEKREKLLMLQKQEDDIPKSNHPDLITSLLSMRDETTNLPVVSDEEIVSNSIAAMIAGHDTTSVLLTFLVKILAENQDVYQNVLDEQVKIAKGKKSKELTWDDLAKMKYTWRVATETMRMHPPIFSTFRTVLKDIEYEGYVISKGWKIYWVANMTHMDESIFPNPTKFDPSRFENQGATPPYSYIAFGAGARMCPGYELARIETLTMIHHLITGFQWKLSQKESFFNRNPMPYFRDGLPIHVELKKSDDAAL